MKISSGGGIDGKPDESSRGSGADDEDGGGDGDGGPVVNDKKPGIQRVGRSNVLESVKKFLPQLKTANEDLDKSLQTEGGGDRFNIEKLEDGHRQHIRMDLYLGVLEEQQSPLEEQQSPLEELRLPDRGLNKFLHHHRPIVVDVADVVVHEDEEDEEKARPHKKFLLEEIERPVPTPE